jgi:hypothetical protein
MRRLCEQGNDAGEGSVASLAESSSDNVAAWPWTRTPAEEDRQHLAEQFRRFPEANLRTRIGLLALTRQESDDASTTA